MTRVEPATDVGWFTEPDRRTVTAESISWLAAYFADASTWTLTNQASVGRTNVSVVSDLARLVRMRVALASMQRLEPLIEHILIRPSFTYTRRVEESVGALRGPLDIQRYIRQRSRPESPRRYPVRIVHRRYDTAENVLTAYAALHLDQSLADAPLHLLPPNAPERREVERSRTLIKRWMQHRALTESISEAQQALRRRHLDRLLDSATRRVESGRVAAPGRYQRLIDWMHSQDITGIAGIAGDIEWSFYDARFDTKLFEIWSLARLAASLEEVLGLPTDTARLLERSGSAVRSWDFGGVSIKLRYQPSLASLTPHDTPWTYTQPEQAHLRGYPDIAVVIQPVVGDPHVLLIDPKLRQREGPPAEEIYKLLGYYGNLTAQTPRGAIIFYAPGRPRTYELERADTGHLLAVGIDPEDIATTETGFQKIANLVTTVANIPPAVLSSFASTDREDGEDIAAIRQHFAVQAMRAASASLTGGELAPVEKATAASLGGHWDQLPAEAQQMLVTAEYFGTHAPADADHSGPLLGLAAACEATLYSLLIDEATIAAPGSLNDGATFGTMIYWVNDATYTRHRTSEGAYLRQFIIDQKPAIDFDAVRQMIPMLRELNVKYRIPAAHRHVVSQQLWADGRSRVLDQHSGVLAQLIVTCQPPGDPKAH